MAIAILIPVVEEILFRGLLYGALERRLLFPVLKQQANFSSQKCRQSGINEAGFELTFARL